MLAERNDEAVVDVLRRGVPTSMTKEGIKMLMVMVLAVQGALNKHFCFQPRVFLPA